MRSPRPVLAGLIGVLALSGCADAASTASVSPTSSSTRDVQVSATFTTTAGVAVTYDEVLVPAGTRGAVSSRSGEGSATVMLALRGLEPERRYGAHVHSEPCGETGADAGPHFQYEVDPVQPSVDPQYANPDNEIWLDLTTDGTGAGSAETTVAWEFPDDRRPGSVVIHAMPTATGPGEAGTAGDRAACITVDF
ncbi:superoxide dismutase family protein [Pseudonocardia nigra]|uniref:superoxide dismutase family protein n=1 Tax=Pseudonocardia nigra TaxID=1921578 RepID=UPI001C5FDD5F|nr:superoxide dismutase family protein [Pseudonocardia nigra]